MKKYLYLSSRSFQLLPWRQESISSPLRVNVLSSAEPPPHSSCVPCVNIMTALHKQYSRVKTSHIYTRRIDGHIASDWLLADLNWALLDFFYLKKASENVYILLYKHPAHVPVCPLQKSGGCLWLWGGSSQLGDFHTLNMLHKIPKNVQFRGWQGHFIRIKLSPPKKAASWESAPKHSCLLSNF